MKYTQPSFTEPVSTGKITTEQYEIAVGARCPHCLKKIPQDTVIDFESPFGGKYRKITKARKHTCP